MHVSAAMKEAPESYYTNSHVRSNTGLNLPIKKKKKKPPFANNCSGSSVFLCFLRICRCGGGTKADGWREKTVRHACCQLLLTRLHEAKGRLPASSQTNGRRSGISASISDPSCASGSLNCSARAAPATLTPPGSRLFSRRVKSSKFWFSFLNQSGIMS